MSRTSKYPQKWRRIGPQCMVKSCVCVLLLLLLLSVLSFKERNSLLAVTPVWNVYELLGREFRAEAKQDVKDLAVSPVYPRIVIYNRVPKCASATMLRIIKSMSYMNKFSYKNMADVDKNYKTLEKQQQLADWIFGMPSSKRYLFFQHMMFLNFTRFGFWEPTWMNMIRHPVNRFISYYYYEKPYQPLDVCIWDNICNFPEWNVTYITPQITYFCGYDSICKEEGNREALQRAKQTVERKFVVVGLQEELSNTLFLLESLLPQFFVNATRIEFDNYNVLSSKPPTSNKTLAFLEEKLKVDIEFYDFMKQRFFAQLEMVKRKQNEDLNSTNSEGLENIDE